MSERKVLEQKAYMLFYVRDKKSPVPKKSVDVARNDNVITNGLGNKMYSNNSQRFKDTAENGFHVKNVDPLSGAKDQRETLSAEVSKGTSIKDPALPKVNGAIVSGSSSLGGAIQPETLLKVPETGDGVKDFSVVEASDGPSSTKANPDVPVSNGIHRLDNEGKQRCENSTPPPDNGDVIVKDLTCSAAIPFGSSIVKNVQDASTPEKPLNIDLHKQVECSKADTNSRVVIFMFLSDYCAMILLMSYVLAFMLDSEFSCSALLWFGHGLLFPCRAWPFIVQRYCFFNYNNKSIKKSKLGKEKEAMPFRCLLFIDKFPFR